METKLYFTIEELNNIGKSTLVENLGIIITELDENHITAEMPVDERTVQPFKILHGGANLALAETIGGALSLAIMDPEKYMIKGIEINANHIKSVPKGEKVTATATFLHKGRSSHITQISIKNSNNNLVSISRLTNFIQKKKA
ncbi:MAG: hotdog fold thioesterase [Bacteroidota bacterium]|nr:hotdog fold thioesterase [Bacteroidota bacterium]